MKSIAGKALQFIQEASISLILTGIILIFSVSDAALAFSGVLDKYLVYGIGLMMVSTIVTTLIISWASQHKKILSLSQDTSVIILAIAGGTLANRLNAEGMQDQLLPTFVMFIIISSVITGASMIFLGLFKLGNFARFIPHHVLGGFLLGTGLMIIVTSWVVITGKEFDIYRLIDYIQPEYIGLWGPAFVAAAIFFVTTRIIRKVLVFPLLIITMIGTFYIVVYFIGLSIEEIQSKGVLLGPFPEGKLWNLPSASLLERANWAALYDVIGNVVILAILTPLSLLLNVTGIETEANVDLSLNKELKYAGLANVVSPLLGGGVISYQSIVGTEMSDKLGAKTRIVSTLVVILLAVLLIYSINLIGLLPKFVIAGMILYLGIELTINWLYDFKDKFNYIEYFTMIFIGIMILSVGFLEGIGIGTLISLVIFVVKYSRIQIVKQLLKGSYIHSNVERNNLQRNILSEKGDQIRLFKLHGFLFFGNAHEFLKSVTGLVREKPGVLKYVIIDFKDVKGLDSSSIYSFSKLHGFLQETEAVLVFTHIPPFLKEMLLPIILDKAEKERIKVFDDLDHGLEWCENQLLKSEGYAEETQTTLSSYLRSFVDTETKVQDVINELEYLSVEKGYNLFSQGELSDDVYFLDSGYVEVILESKEGKNIRLRSIGPGTVVGEIGFFLNEARSATVKTKDPCEVYRLSKSKLKSLKKSDPEIAFILEEAIIRQLASRLIYGNEQVQGLMNEY